MKSSLNNLNAFVAQSLHPLNLAASNLTKNEFSAWEQFLQIEGREFRLRLISCLLGPEQQSQKQHQLSSIQRQLLLLSDQVNTFLVRDRKYWLGHVQASEIRRHYLLTLTFFDQLRDFIQSRFPDLFNTHLKLPDVQLKNIVPVLRARLNDLGTHLEACGINRKLTQMLLKGLRGLLRGGLSLAQHKYISGITARLMSLTSLDDGLLQKILVESNFNMPEFYLHLVDQLDDRLLAINGLHEQLEYLSQQENQFSKLSTGEEMAFSHRFPKLKAELHSYCTERQLILEKLMNIRRAVIQDRIATEQAFRMLTELSVPALALFVRVQLEVGLLLKDQVTEVFNFFAQHFYTRNTLFISSGSLMKRSTDVEFSTVLSLYDKLEKMMEWLDEKFSVSNFKR